jgi:hypothetical protein
MREAHQAVEVKGLDPFHPRIFKEAAVVVSALKIENLESLELGCLRIAMIARELPQGAFRWNPGPTERN